MPCRCTPAARRIAEPELEVPGVAGLDHAGPGVGRRQCQIERADEVAELAAGCVQAGWGLRRVSPRAVVGFGGYASVPTVLAAAATALPTIIHEQNAVLGRANRLLAKHAGRIATTFETISGLPRGVEHKVVRNGMPVRPSFQIS